MGCGGGCEGGEMGFCCSAVLVCDGVGMGFDGGELVYSGEN